MKYCIANWKMNMNHHQADSYIEKLYGLMCEQKDSNDTLMILCPPYTLLDFIWYNEMFIAMSNEEMLISTPQLGVQNINPNNEGAYTGEISPTMIKSYCDGEWEPMGFVANWAIIGHSERRALFHESNVKFSRREKFFSELSSTFGLLQALFTNPSILPYFSIKSCAFFLI